MTSSIVIRSDDEELNELNDTSLASEADLKALVKEQQQQQPNNYDDDAQHQVHTEQDEFNKLSKDRKFDRLNNLIEKSQIYSKIIADNILQTSLENKKIYAAAKGENEQQQQQQLQQQLQHETNKRRRTGDTSTPSSQKDKKRKTRSTEKDGKLKSRDITTMLSTSISDSTKTTREKIEKSQTEHSTSQPNIVSGAVMKDYQLDGLEWLLTLYQNGLNGILADEMGLGKTLQCISFLAYLIENGIKGPFLVVVPLSTLSNWANELQKFAPSIKVLKYAGAKQERANIELYSTKANVVITSYEISIKDFHKFSLINWAYLIVDEGHRLKNSQCLLIKILKKLNTTNRLLITGTPLQNNLNELWSLLNFILPDIFHDLELFQQWFNFDELTTIEQNEQDEETKKFIKYNIQETLIKNLHTILKPFILRRLKKDVIKDLPPKKEYIIHIPLSGLQRKIYLDALNNQLQQGLVETYFKEFIEYNHKQLFKDYDLNAFLESKFKPKVQMRDKRIDRASYKEAESEDEFEVEVDETEEKNDSGSLDKQTPSYEEALEQIHQIKTTRDKQQQLILESLYTKVSSHIRHLKLQALRMVQLRNICNSPYLYYEPFPMDGEHDEQFMNRLVTNSCKFQALEQILLPLITNTEKEPTLETTTTTRTAKTKTKSKKNKIGSVSSQNHKCLIFSQFTKVMDLIQDWLHFQNIKACRLDGLTPQEERAKQISQFNDSNSSYKVFLLSTRAGGLGINLTGADTVILFDNDWNPQMDLQAIDRVHRIGQTKPVKIYRFVVRDSIEEILIAKSSSKRFLEKLVIQMGEFKFNKIKQMIGEGDKGNDDVTELDVKQLLELSKNNFRYKLEFENEIENAQEKGKENGNENTAESELFECKRYGQTGFKLTREELQELLDRSDECYYKDLQDDSRYKNITIFETVNNMDK